MYFHCFGAIGHACSAWLGVSLGLELVRPRSLSLAFSLLGLDLGQLHVVKVDRRFRSVFYFVLLMELVCSIRNILWISHLYAIHISGFDTCSAWSAARLRASSTPVVMLGLWLTWPCSFVDVYV